MNVQKHGTSDCQEVCFFFLPSTSVIELYSSLNCKPHWFIINIEFITITDSIIETVMFCQMETFVSAHWLNSVLGWRHTWLAYILVYDDELA